MGLKDYGPKTRRNVLLIIAFYVGMIGFWAGIFEMGEPRGRKRPALNPLGCIPYQRYTCPPSMACVLDFEYAPYYGRCTCDIVRAQITRPPVFDDQELDDPWNATNNCTTDWVSAWLQLLITLPIIFSLAMFARVAITTLWRLVRQNDLFKWNSTTRGLVILILTYFVSFEMYHIFYLLNVFGLDKHSVMHDYIANLGSFLLEFSYNLGSYELTISWFDLVQRTIKMSRTSAKSMTYIKIFMRVFNIVWNMVLVNVIKIPQDTRFKYLQGMLGFHTAIQVIPGIILARMLCKDKKDVTNPNYKAAQIIRRTIIIVVQSLVLYILGLQTLIKSVYPGYFNRAGNQYYGAVILGYSGIFMGWAWMHYTLFGCRKLLNSYSSDSDKVSQYFGFTTIGLNSTLVSRASAMVSSVASMASTASVAERDDDDVDDAEDGDKKENENDVA